MTGNELRPKRGKIAFDDVKVGSADATGEYTEQQMAGDELRAGNVCNFQRRC